LGADPAVVSVSGDLKLEPDSEPRPVRADLGAALGDAPLFVAGSTHPGEEAAALEAFAVLERADVAATLVIAPRHIERADEVERTARDAGCPVRRRTALGPERLRAGEVLVLDTLGELASLYAHAAAAFVGGTLVPVGGHNVLEPVLAGCPVLYGPHTQNVRHGIEILEACDAGRRLESARALGPAVLAMLRDPAEASRRGEAGRAALQRHSGSAERAAALVARAVASPAHAGCAR
jgi:3-deoxy-D-manno-octulosonic-acid transferase